jgi:hypothetical protein
MLRARVKEKKKEKKRKKIKKKEILNHEHVFWYL